MNLTQQIPGLAEAIERENFIRSAAFLPVFEKVSGVEVMPLTIRHLIALDAIGSPFMRGGVPMPQDIAAALWLLSPQHSPSSFRRWLFMRRIRNIKYSTAIMDLDEYFSEAFQDSPGTSCDREYSPSYYSFAAALVDLFANKYHWSEQEIISIPVKRLFQYQNIIRRRMDPTCTMFNPSDRVRGEWLKCQNERQD